MISGRSGLEGHISPQDIDQLGQLVQTAFADHFSDRSDAVVIFLCQAGYAVLLRIGTHAAELHDIELSLADGTAHLLVQYRAAVIQLDRQ